MKNAFELLGILALLLSWEIFSLLASKPILVPSVGSIFQAVFDIFAHKTSYIHIFFTVLRVFITLTIDLSLALLLALLAGINPKIEKIFFASESFLRSLPTAVVILLALIYFRSNFTPIFVASLLVFPLIYRNIVDAIKNINSYFIEMSNDFRVSLFTRIRYVYLPHCFFALKSSFTTALGLAIKVIVMSELLSQPNYGIGTSLQTAKTQLDTASLFAWGIITVLLAVILQKISTLKTKAYKGLTQ